MKYFELKELKTRFYLGDNTTKEQAIQWIMNNHSFRLEYIVNNLIEIIIL